MVSATTLIPEGIRDKVKFVRSFFSFVEDTRRTEDIFEFAETKTARNGDGARLATEWARRQPEIRALMEARHGMGKVDLDALAAFSQTQLPTGPLSTIILAAGMLNRLRVTPRELEDLMDTVAAAWKRGLGSESLMGYAWEQHFSDPIARVRGDLHLRPRDDGFPPESAEHTGDATHWEQPALLERLRTLPERAAFVAKFMAASEDLSKAPALEALRGSMTLGGVEAEDALVARTVTESSKAGDGQADADAGRQHGGCEGLQDGPVLVVVVEGPGDLADGAGQVQQGGAGDAGGLEGGARGGGEDALGELAEGDVVHRRGRSGACGRGGLLGGVERAVHGERGDHGVAPSV